MDVLLVLHIAAGITAVVSGAIAASSRKRPGRHPRAGTVYLAGLAVVVATATAMAALRWRQDWHLFAIAMVAGGAGGLGLLARRVRWRGWLGWHGATMAASYVGLLTGFYVDNGERLPLWNRLPHLSYWLLPTAVGLPLTVVALVRNGVIGRRRAARRTTGPPRRPGSTAPR